MMPLNPLLIDVGPLCECETNHALEMMHKALSERSGDDDIWRPHESEFIRELIEKATAKGLTTLDALKLELHGWLRKSKRGGKPAPKPVGRMPMERWSSSEMAGTRAYLEGIPQELWAADDYVLLVDYLIQKHLPPNFALSQAEWLVKRAAIMGKVQAATTIISAEQATALLAKFAEEGKLDAALRMAKFNQAIIDYGQAKCADYIVQLTDSARHKIKSAILDYQQTVLLGGKPDNTSLIQKLNDHFADMNRDWRRIALTEAGEMTNQGFVAGVAPGEKVKRIEQYKNACSFCQKMDGVVVTVVDPAAEDKDWDTQVWVGKTNVGRSASPYKRVGTQLVKRAKDEMWAIATGTFHPHCRGRWVKLGKAATADEFSLWLDGFLAKKSS